MFLFHTYVSRYPRALGGNFYIEYLLMLSILQRNSMRYFIVITVNTGIRYSRLKLFYRTLILEIKFVVLKLFCKFDLTKEIL